MKSFVILSVNTYNHSLCVCGMIVYSNVGVTYGGIGIIGVFFGFFSLSSLFMWDVHMFQG